MASNVNRQFLLKTFSQTYQKLELVEQLIWMVTSRVYLILLGSILNHMESDRMVIGYEVVVHMIFEAYHLLSETNTLKDLKGL